MKCINSSKGIKLGIHFMFYTIYKITNTINGNIYIGKHKTKDVNDYYMGSGKHLKRAQEKYGIENFKKTILFIFDNEKDMNDKEAELVTEIFVKEDTNYNLCPGGKGGWGYINTNQIRNGFENTMALEHIKKICLEAGKRGKQTQKELRKHNPEWVQAISDKKSKSLKQRFKNGHHWVGRHHNDDTKNKISMQSKIHQKGAGNSQYGTMWITNGLENKKIQKSEPIPAGWHKGRMLGQPKKVQKTKNSS